MLNLNAIIDKLASEHELMYEVAVSKWYPEEPQRYNQAKGSRVTNNGQGIDIVIDKISLSGGMVLEESDRQQRRPRSTVERNSGTNYVIVKDNMNGNVTESYQSQVTQQSPRLPGYHFDVACQTEIQLIEPLFNLLDKVKKQNKILSQSSQEVHQGYMKFIQNRIIQNKGG